MKNFKNSIWFFSTQSNFKRELAALFAVLSLQYSTANTTLPTDSADLSRPQIEVVTGDPIKELMAEYKIATIEDIEMMYFDDLVKMLKKIYTITAGNNNLTDEEKKIIDKLEEVAEWTKPWSVASIKALSGSDKELSQEEILDQQLADAQQALEAKKQEVQQLDKTIDALKQQGKKIDETIAAMQKKKELLARWKQQTQTPSKE